MNGFNDSKANIRRWQGPLPERIFAIGDIHGADIKLGHLIVHLLSKLNFGPRDYCVFLGDIVDRGTGVRLCVELISQLRLVNKNNVTALRGNHEDAFMSAFGLIERNRGRGIRYLDYYSGLSTVLSYEIEPPQQSLDSKDFSLADCADQIPSLHRDFFLAMEEGLLIGKYLFTHAVISGFRSLDQLTLDDVLSARHDSDDEIDGHLPHNLFLPSGESIINVHGHDSVWEPWVDDYRINVDTYCGKKPDGLLSMVEILPEQAMAYSTYERIYQFDDNGFVS